MRILVFGYHQIAYLCLRHLLKLNENVVGLFTYTNSKNENIWFKTPDLAAAEYGVPIFYNADLKAPKIKKKIETQLKPDLVFSFYYREKLPDYILNLPRFSAINLHGSYLPYFRGCAPLNWSLVKGAKFTGVTLHYMTSVFDAGDILARVKYPIFQTDDINTLYSKFHKFGLELFQKTFPSIKNGTVKPIKQDTNRAAYFGRRKPEDGRIRWKSMSSTEIYNLIRAVTDPYPGAFTFYQNSKLIFLKSEIIRQPRFIANLKLKTGEAIYKEMRFYVKCNDGKILMIYDFDINNKIIAKIIEDCAIKPVKFEEE